MLLKMTELSKIFNEYYNLLFNYGRKFTLDNFLVEDAIQNIFVGLLKKKHPFNYVDNIKCYLLVSIRNELFRLIKKTNTFEFVDFTDNVINFTEQTTEADEDCMEQPENYLELHVCLNNLSPKQREMIFLRFNLDLSYEEISQTLNISVESCRTSLYRALKNMKEDFVKLKKNSQKPSKPVSVK